MRGRGGRVNQLMEGPALRVSLCSLHFCTWCACYRSWSSAWSAENECSSVDGLVPRCNLLSSYNSLLYNPIITSAHCLQSAPQAFVNLMLMYSIVHYGLVTQSLHPGWTNRTLCWNPLAFPLWTRLLVQVHAKILFASWSFLWKLPKTLLGSHPGYYLVVTLMASLGFSSYGVIVPSWGYLVCFFITVPWKILIKINHLPSILLVQI